MADEHVAEELTLLRGLSKRLGMRHFVRRRRDALVYHAVQRLLVRLRGSSLPDAMRFADRAADLAYVGLPGVRRLALTHIEIALGTTHSPAAREQIARQSYRTTARACVELAKLDDIRPQFDDYVSLDGWEHIEAMRALNRGAVVVTGHVGNPDLLAAYIIHRGIGISAIARQLEDPRLNALLMDFRRGYGAHLIFRNSPEAGRELLRLVKRRGVLALQIDLDVRVPSVSVPFFGRIARTPAAAAVLALRGDLPVVPAFMRRRPEGGQHITVMPPLWGTRSGDRLHDIKALTTACNQALEAAIIQRPDEANWWHRRWRRPPVAGLDLDAGTPAGASTEVGEAPRFMAAEHESRVSGSP